MTPNTIELDEKGIFCYEAPQKYDPNTSYRYQDVIDGIEKEKKALEAAKRDRVYFKDQSNMLHTFVSKGKIIEQGKSYPIPDGYEVKIEKEWEVDPECPTGLRQECIGKYAILVPKEKVEPYMGGLGMSNEQLEKQPRQPSIEEAADAYVFNSEFNLPMNLIKKNSYIAGAKWMEQQLKQQKP